MTIMVQDREVKIPKLNLNLVIDTNDVFQDNIPFTPSSSSCASQSEITQSQMDKIHLNS